ncbi:MAG TPA: hypothetical protein VF188_15165 [Longimicrobiales bacterium]
MRFIIFGGGCYGTFYARQLLRARQAGALRMDRVVVVDREREPRARQELGGSTDVRFEHEEWDDFLDRYLEGLPIDSADQLVTPPFTPHLALAWILRRLRQERPDAHWRLEPFRRFPGTPFERQAEGGPLVVSHADWICPVHCVEPEVCPKTRGDRYWDLDRTVRQFATALADGGQPVEQIHLFHCHHVAFGVGAYPAAAVVRALHEILDDGSPRSERTPRRFLVGTISHCHGALHLLSSGIGTFPVEGGEPHAAAR